MYSLQNLQFYTGGGSNTPPVRPPEKKSGQTEGVRACNFCRTSHAACDSERPCGRCVRTGRAEQCFEVPPRKRGRPPRHAHETYFPQRPLPESSIPSTAVASQRQTWSRTPTHSATSPPPPLTQHSFSRILPAAPAISADEPVPRPANIYHHLWSQAEDAPQPVREVSAPDRTHGTGTTTTTSTRSLSKKKAKKLKVDQTSNSSTSGEEAEWESGGSSSGTPSPVPRYSGTGGQHGSADRAARLKPKSSRASSVEADTEMDCLAPQPLPPIGDDRLRPPPQQQLLLPTAEPEPVREPPAPVVVQEPVATGGGEPPPADDESKFTRLMEMIGGEMRELKRTNEKLVKKVKRLKAKQTESDHTIGVLIAAERQRQEAKQRKLQDRHQHKYPNTQHPGRFDHANALAAAAVATATTGAQSQLRHHDLGFVSTARSSKHEIEAVCGPTMPLVTSMMEQLVDDTSTDLAQLFAIPDVQPPSGNRSPSSASLRSSSLSSTSSSSSSSFSSPLDYVVSTQTSSVSASTAVVPRKRSSFSSEIALLHSFAPPGLLMEAMLVLPFLRHYAMPTRFAVLDFTYPVCSLTSAVDDGPPTLTFANAAFTHLANRSWEEMMGAPFHEVFAVHQANYKKVAHLILNRPPLTSSEVFTFRALMRCGGGKFLRITENVQFFYGTNGILKETLVCVINWQEGHLEEGEVLEWIPLRTLFNAPPGAASHRPGYVAHQHQGAATPSNPNNCDPSAYPHSALSSSSSPESLLYLPSAPASSSASAPSSTTPVHLSLAPQQQQQQQQPHHQPPLHSHHNRPPPPPPPHFTSRQASYASLPSSSSHAPTSTHLPRHWL